MANSQVERWSFTLRPEQLAALRRTADSRGTSMSALVRQLLDDELGLEPVRVRLGRSPGSRPANRS